MIQQDTIRKISVLDYEKVQQSVLIEEMKKYAELYKEYSKILIEKFVADN